MKKLSYNNNLYELINNFKLDKEIEELLNNFNYDKEIEEFNNLMKKYSKNDVIRLIPPHNYLCKDCTKMATFIINNKYKCWMHYYINLNNDN
jgi:hypothetical protein